MWFHINIERVRFPEELIGSDRTLLFLWIELLFEYFDNFVDFIICHFLTFGCFILQHGNEAAQDQILLLVEG